MTATEQREQDRERSRGWHQRRRARGVCSNAPCERRPDLNPKTGLPYWRCRSCRRNAHAITRPISRGTSDTVGPVGVSDLSEGSRRE